MHAADGEEEDEDEFFCVAFEDFEDFFSHGVEVDDDVAQRAREGRRLVARDAARAAEEEQRPEQREFLEGGLALQKLNPEISVTGDMLGAMAEILESGLFLLISMGGVV